LREQYRPGLPRVVTVEEILAWADAHHTTTGQWPTHRTGQVLHAPVPETWNRINEGLRRGWWGLTGGHSLAWLLEEHRQVKPRVSRKCALARVSVRRRLKVDRRDGRRRLTVEQILHWVDEYRTATGFWPRAYYTEPVPGMPGETWKTINAALKKGRWGLPGGSSLRQLLLEHRGPETLKQLTAPTIEQVLSWADAYRAAHGRWPDHASGRVAASPWHTWRGIDTMLRTGRRGLRVGPSLSGLLWEYRKRGGRQRRPALTLEQILSWADAHHEAHGRWPSGSSGPVAAAPTEKWKSISQMLRTGGRGLPGGSSLDRVLAEHRGVRNQTSLPYLTIDQILAWADAHHATTGHWPTSRSGRVVHAPGETWRQVDGALRRGSRGLPGGLSLFRLLNAHRPLRSGSHTDRTGQTRNATPLVNNDAGVPLPAVTMARSVSSGGEPPAFGDPVMG
jgi:hypothetical protein